MEQTAKHSIILKTLGTATDMNYHFLLASLIRRIGSRIIPLLPKLIHQ